MSEQPEAAAKAAEAIPIPRALYSCKLCAEDYSWPAEDMAWSETEKAWICSNCWDIEAHGTTGVSLKALIRSRDEQIAELGSRCAEFEKDNEALRQTLLEFQPISVESQARLREQLAALTDKLATVTAERDEATRAIDKAFAAYGRYVDWLSTPREEILANMIETLKKQRDAHAATIEGLRAELGKWKSSSYASDMTVAALRTRVAELERERDGWKSRAGLHEYSHKALLARSTIEEEEAVKKERDALQSELAQVRRSNSDVIDGFVDRLLSQLEQRGIKTDNWDGEDSVEVILADRIAALATQNPTT